MTLLFAGKKTLITGSRRGIGAEMALPFARYSTDVGIDAVIHDSGADKTNESVESFWSKSLLESGEYRQFR